jgi:hypothetical protein
MILRTLLEPDEPGEPDEPDEPGAPGEPGEPGPTVELLRAGARESEQDLHDAARVRSTRVGPQRRVSRSYAFPYGLLAHHDTAVGVDVERVAPCDVVFAASICTPDELATIRVRDAAGVTSLWSSKEALAKALGDARLYDPRRLASPAGWRQGASGPWRARALTIAPGYRAWVCWRVVAEPARALDTRRQLLAGENAHRELAETSLGITQTLVADPPAFRPQPV